MYSHTALKRSCIALCIGSLSLLALASPQPPHPLSPENPPSSSTPATPIPPSDPHIPTWTAKDIDNECSKLLAGQEKAYSSLSEQPLQKLTLQTLVFPWNALQAQEEDVSGPVGLLANVSPDPTVREAAERCELKLSEAGLVTLQNPKLYERLLAVHPDDPLDQRWKTQMLRQFKEAGAHLDLAKRARLKAISTEIDALSQAFERAMRENAVALSFTETELKGAPEHFLKTQPRNPDGKIRVGLSYPEYEAVMGYAESEATRKVLYLAFTQRGGG